MSNQELTLKAHDLKELKLMQDELAAQIAALETEIKEHMDEAGVDTLITTDVKITWKPVTSARLDTAALKKELPDLVARYTKTSVTRRFIVA